MLLCACDSGDAPGFGLFRGLICDIDNAIAHILVGMATTMLTTVDSFGKMDGKE